MNSKYGHPVVPGNQVVTQIHVIAWIWVSGEYPQLNGGEIDGREVSSSKIREFLLSHWGQAIPMAIEHRGDEDMHVYSVII